MFFFFQKDFTVWNMQIYIQHLTLYQISRRRPFFSVIVQNIDLNLVKLYFS